MIAVIYYAYGGSKSVGDVETYFSPILNGKDVPTLMLKNIDSIKKPAFSRQTQPFHSVT